MISQLVDQMNEIISQLRNEMREMKNDLKACEQKINALQQAKENTQSSQKVTRSQSLRQREGENNPVRGAGSEDSRKAKVGRRRKDESKAEVV